MFLTHLSLTFQLLSGTAAIKSASAQLAREANESAGRVWLAPLEAELWVKRLQRRRLILILNQFTEARRTRSTASPEKSKTERKQATPPRQKRTNTSSDQLCFNS